MTENTGSPIPDDIAEHARTVLPGATSAELMAWDRAVLDRRIARALLAEREATKERAAKIADSWEQTALSLMAKQDDVERQLHHALGADMANDIAAAIRGA